MNYSSKFNSNSPTSIRSHTAADGPHGERASSGPAELRSGDYAESSQDSYSVRRQCRETAPRGLKSLVSLAFLILILLSGCTTSPFSHSPAPVTPADCERAKAWETWLTADSKKQPEFCSKDASASPWCEISEKRPELQKSYMAWRKQRLSSNPGPKARAVRPSWGKNGKLLNLAALQKASVSSIIRGLSKTTRGHLKTLTAESLKSETCSGPLYLALGSAWENFLPKADFKLIAELYDRSAACVASEAEDVTNTRFRGGLFYYAANDFEKARELFEKAAAAPSSTRSRSLFWLYRTHLRLGDNGKADDTIDRLESLHPTSFHGILGIQFAERTPQVRSTSHWFNTRASNAPQLNSLLEAAETLQSCSALAGSIPLTNWAIGQLPPQPDPKLLLYIAKLRETAGENPVKIAIAADALSANPNLVSRETLELFYPRPFWNFFEAQKNVIDPYFLTAVSRQESAFDPGAVSSAKAVGLLQIIPSTGRRFKRSANLRSPKDNVEVGARYLSALLKSTDGKVHHSLASYNAGPGKVKLWVTRYQTNDPILFTDLIPYRETREYVAAVLRNYFWYRTLYGNQADASAVVAGAFPADHGSVVALRQASTPVGKVAEKSTEKPAEKPAEKVAEQIPATEKAIAKAPKDTPSSSQEVPDLSADKKAAGDSQDKPAASAEAAAKVAEDKISGSVGGGDSEAAAAELAPGNAADEDMNQLPDDISIAPEIDKSQPN